MQFWTDAGLFSCDRESNLFLFHAEVCTSNSNRSFIEHYARASSQKYIRAYFSVLHYDTSWCRIFFSFARKHLSLLSRCDIDRNDLYSKIVASSETPKWIFHLYAYPPTFCSEVFAERSTSLCRKDPAGKTGMRKTLRRKQVRISRLLHLLIKRNKDKIIIIINIIIRCSQRCLNVQVPSL